MIKWQIVITYFCLTFALNGAHYRGKFQYASYLGYQKMVQSELENPWS